jgi:branched-chain amino acid transport system permease protein
MSFQMFNLNLLLESIISGFFLGMVYGMVGAGLNLIYGVMRVVNLAHGQFLMLAAFLTYWLGVIFDLDPLTSVIIVIPLFFTLGMIIYYVLIPRLEKAEDTEAASFITFYGLALAIAASALVAWGADTRGIPYPYGPPSLDLYGIKLATGRLVSFIISVGVVAAMTFFLYKTFTGKALRAIIQNRPATRILGINTKRLSALSFGMGLSLVGLAGSLITLIFPAIYPGMGALYTIIAFAVITLGGIGNPIGAIGGGVIFGMAQSITAVFLPLAYSPAIAFFILITVIMIRPQGLSGKKDIVK